MRRVHPRIRAKIVPISLIIIHPSRRVVLRMVRRMPRVRWHSSVLLASIHVVNAAFTAIMRPVAAARLAHHPRRQHRLKPGKAIRWNANPKLLLKKIDQAIDRTVGLALAVRSVEMVSVKRRVLLVIVVLVVMLIVIVDSGLILVLQKSDKVRDG